MSQKQIHINFKNMVEIVAVGIRRASSFMALGLRAAADTQIKSVQLDSNFQIQFLPNELSEAQLAKIKGTFSQWIVASGLRELDQHFAIFADTIYEILVLAAFEGKQVTRKAIKRINRFKEGTNVASKLHKIAEQFKIDSPFRSHMVALSKARNALTHNLGIVTARHCDDGKILHLTWMGLDMLAGERVISGPFEPFNVEKDTAIQIRSTLRERNIPVGTKIELSPHDLHEICLNYSQQAGLLVNAVQEYLRKQGVSVSPEETVAKNQIISDNPTKPQQKD